VYADHWCVTVCFHHIFNYNLQPPPGMETHNLARSREGHAAKAGVDKWILIQDNTFKNWVNEQLRTAGVEVTNLEADFDDGVRLCLLIQALQGKRFRIIKNPKNHHQQLANATEALQAISNDNIKLVNIGKSCLVLSCLELCEIISFSCAHKTSWFDIDGYVLELTLEFMTFQVIHKNTKLNKYFVGI